MPLKGAVEPEGASAQSYKPSTSTSWALRAPSSSAEHLAHTCSKHNEHIESCLGPRDRSDHCQHHNCVNIKALLRCRSKTARYSKHVIMVTSNRSYHETTETIFTASFSIGEYHATNHRWQTLNENCNCAQCIQNRNTNFTTVAAICL